MHETVATVVTSPAVEAGLKFVWIISFGQVCTILIFVLGLIWSAARFVTDARSNKRALVSITAEMAVIKADVKREMAILRNDVRALTRAYLLKQQLDIPTIDESFHDDTPSE